MSSTLFPFGNRLFDPGGIAICGVSAQFLLLFLLLNAGWSAPALAGPPAARLRLRAVTLEQGLEIIDSATEHYPQVSDKPDCSHLVHEIYRFAGYTYRYASSSDLYWGTGEFLRVWKPQPGDLVAWRGHVGLVVNPANHSFYSSLRTGLHTEDYTSTYWRRRGIPRFYRYRLKNGLGSEAATRRKRTQVSAEKTNWPPS